MAEEGKKKKRKRLVEIRTRHADDGTHVHHHTYQGEDGKDEPERENVATSQTSDEAGQHVAEQMGMNDSAPAPDPAASQGVTPDPTQGGGAPGQ
jgi:hypothetical protein